MAEYQLLGWKGGGQVFNDKKFVLTQHTGPTSYTAITPGAPPAAPTGGDAISAKACGLNFIEAIIVMGDSAGKYSGQAFIPPVSTSGVLAGSGAASTSVPFMWTTAATGAEVAGATNLSAAQINLLVIGG